jgi:MFS transporter, PAT family, beta-lactamase induction signal transducer AmpG
MFIGFYMLRVKTIPTYLNPRLLAMLVLGLTSGLPLALTGATLQAWFAESGINIVVIGSLSLIGMPYVWKFLWSPLMDRFSPFHSQRRKSWILLTQFALCIALLALSTFEPTAHPYEMGLIALVIAFLSASQDIAIDAYRTDVLLPKERGIGSAYFIFAYRMAMLVSGGLALILADRLGWHLTYQIMAVVLIICLVLNYFVPSINESSQHSSNILIIVKQSFLDLWNRQEIILLLLFAVFYKLGDAFAATLMSTFLLKGLSFSLTEIGMAYKTASLVATILGAMLGGALLLRLNLFRALFLFGLVQSFSILLFMLLAIVGKNFMVMLSAIFIENFCSGMGTAAFMAFLMSLCNQEYTATQYACLSALSAMGRVFLGPLAGVMVGYTGWAVFYLWAFIFSLPGLLILALLHRKVNFHAKLAEC